MTPFVKESINRSAVNFASGLGVRDKNVHESHIRVVNFNRLSITL